MVEPAAQLGRSLRGHRDATRLSLAARSGVSKASLSMIEAGAANSSLETLWRLAGALGVSLGTLLPHRYRSSKGARCLLTLSYSM